MDLQPVLALRHLPAAAWTAMGSIRAEALGEGSDRWRPLRGALLAHAGGTVQGLAAPRDAAALEDRSPDPAVVAADAWLAGAAGEGGLARRYLGIPAADWRDAPRVQRLRCGAGPGRTCTGGIDGANDGENGGRNDGANGAAGGSSLASPRPAGALEGAVAVAGDWHPPAGVPIGTRAAPAIVWVDGHLRLTGPAEVHGLLLARSIEVDARSGPVRWNGAAVSDGDIVLRGPVHMVRDAAVLEALLGLPIAWWPVAGSWRETVPVSKWNEPTRNATR